MKPNPVLGWLMILALALTAAAPLGASPGSSTPAGPENWPHFGYDDAFSAYNPLETTLDTGNVSRLRRIWGLGCGQGYQPIAGSPAIYNYRLYTSGEVDNLKAHDALSGTQLWAFGKDSPWAPQPVVSDDGVVFHLEEGASTIYNLYAVDFWTGSQLWKAPLSFDLGYSDSHMVAVDETRGLVYMPAVPFMGDGKLYALDKADGHIVWSMSPAVDHVDFLGDHLLLSGGKLFASADVPMAVYPNHGAHLVRINPDTHAVDTTYKRPAPEAYYDIKTFALCGDKLFVNYDYQSNPNKLLAAYNLDAPEIAWSKVISETTGSIACNPALNRIYLPTDPYLYALNVADGSQVWRYTGYAEIRSPSIANGVLYFLSDTNLYALDEANGGRLFSYPLGKEPYENAQVAIAGGLLYFSGNGGDCNLFALGLPSRRACLPMLLR